MNWFLQNVKFSAIKTTIAKNNFLSGDNIEGTIEFKNRDYKPKDVIIDLKAKATTTKNSKIFYKEKFSIDSKEYNGYNSFQDLNFCLVPYSDFLVSKDFLKRENKKVHPYSKINYFI